jgi:hypothetical protein
LQDEVVRTAGGASVHGANVDICAGRSGGNTSRPDRKWWRCPFDAGQALGAPRDPGVVGMTDWIKQDVARFASQGYVALAVDLRIRLARQKLKGS